MFLSMAFFAKRNAIPNIPKLPASEGNLDERHQGVGLFQIVKYDRELFDVVSVELTAHLAAMLAGVGVADKNFFNPGKIFFRVADGGLNWGNSALPSKTILL